ncbi:hypothetical protein Taro_055696 [Colocasia esculenta]|uniref:Uncharacterized protein n=1 Tax=Colocasia esculenta TaxID=4460 RepID=A0A843XUA6_COLES|nr:hypothetical protein [Colocasia esculenta]
MDAEKQEAMNVFLGYFQPQQCESSLWELDYNVETGHNYVDENSRMLLARAASRMHDGWSFFERSLSDGSIVCESCTPVSSTHNGQKRLINSALPDKISEGRTRCHSDSTPEMSICESDVSYSRYSPSSICRKLFTESAHAVLNGHGADPSNWSNFLDIDYLSSSGNSCEEEIYDRSSIVNSPSENISTESLVNGTMIETAPMLKENGFLIMGQDSTEKLVAFGAAGNMDKLGGFSDSFVHWVVHGETLCH